MKDEQVVTFYIQLTRRQRAVVELASRGMRNREIAVKLHITSNVVADHLSNIYAEMATLDSYAHVQPNRYHLIHLFAGFFDRHPEMRNADAA